MLGAIARRLFGSANERYVKTLQPDVDAINGMEAEVEALSDDALRARTPALRLRLENGEAMDVLLVEADVSQSDACRRVVSETVASFGGRVFHRPMVSPSNHHAAPKPPQQGRGRLVICPRGE